MSVWDHVLDKLVEYISAVLYAAFLHQPKRSKRSKKSMESMYIDVLHCILFLPEE